MKANHPGFVHADSDRIERQRVRLADEAAGDVARRCYNLANTRPQQHIGASSLDRLCVKFEKYQGLGIRGFYTDFLGVKTRLDYIPNQGALDGVVLDYPSRDPPMHDPVEWESMLLSVLQAKDRFVAIELGAGWGPWLVASAAAARQRGIKDIRLAGVEGSVDHFNSLVQHFSDNGIDPAAHFLFHGIVGSRDGIAYFPKLPDGQSDWGAQAVTTSESDLFDEQAGGFVDYRGVVFESLEKVSSLALSTLLKRYDHVDLIHCDIQDSEGEVIPSAFGELDKRVRRIVIGTHSRRSESALLNVFSAAGWTLEHDVACQYVVSNDRVVLTNDGVQVWANPRLALG